MTSKIKEKKDKEKVVYHDRITYMPHPRRMGVSREMGRGPYEKSGLLRETSLPPNKKVKEEIEIPYPYKDVEKNGETRRELTSDEMQVELKLWYVPYGEFDGSEVLFFSDKRTVKIADKWKFRH